MPRLRIDALHHDEAPVQGLPAQPKLQSELQPDMVSGSPRYRPRSNYPCMTGQDPTKGLFVQLENVECSGVGVEPAQLRAHFRRLCSLSMA